MPKREDIQSVLLIGAGPIVIGQACEFDYSGTQACQALKEEGCRVILVNSNPATIMTDPNMADATYIEPIHWRVVAKIIEKEKPDAILPTMGGQTALNCALDLAREGILEKYGVELIGANKEAIDKAEDRQLFREAMKKIGLNVPKSGVAHNIEDSWALQKDIGFPVIIRPSFTLGGEGGGIAYNREEFLEICENGLDLSPTTEILIEESILGWKEFEMEVVRDKADNCIIICAIENVDPMGVHTGDSITVAPAQTLTDKEYQIMRDASFKVMREIGVETGGSNVQFAVNPEDGRLIVIEMNPRVSRSSALASKATGFPIAKVATKLALGYTLDELRHKITGGLMPASFEPTLDYVVTKIPRFNFEKFPGAENHLTTQMKSVGEVMAMGRTFQESLQKAISGLETGVIGLQLPPKLKKRLKNETSVWREVLGIPTPERLFYVAEAFRQQLTLDEVYQITKIDPWFLAQIAELVTIERRIQATPIDKCDETLLRQWKRKGFSDKVLAHLLGEDEKAIYLLRQKHHVKPVYKRVDTCAAEFPTQTAYMYSTYETMCEARPTEKQKIVILGGGPNRIGQGIEFDYCCVHAAMALSALGFETVMINCNPETVSTDYDISNRLYFEPLTLEHVLSIVDLEKPVGVIVQFGGQTPLRLVKQLEAFGAPIVGTLPEAIDRAEDREQFAKLLKKLDVKQPESSTVRSEKEAIKSAEAIGYPVMVRPSYVLGGRGMEIVYSTEELKRYIDEAVSMSNDAPVLIDRYLSRAVEVDVDAVCDGENVLIGGILEHIEQAGVHSGDSASCLPPYTLSTVVQQQLKTIVTKIAKALPVVGLINAQFAIQDEEIYVIEVNPRASRTVPFIAKAINLPLAKIAAKCMVGETLEKQGVTQEILPYLYHLKAPVFPFSRYRNVDTLLGPEMRSTGEVMGIGQTFSEAFAKSELATGNRAAKLGTAFLSVSDADKPLIGEIGRMLFTAGFQLVATRGTQRVLNAAGIPCAKVNKVMEGRPHIVDKIKNREIDFIVNTADDARAIKDSFSIRRNALQHRVCYQTTMTGAKAAAKAMTVDPAAVVRCLQEEG